MKSEVILKFRRRLLREFLDLILLSELRNRSLSGYDALSFVHNKYDYLVSSGTVYSLLYSLERDGLVEGRVFGPKRMFELTNTGKEMITSILTTNDDVFVLAKKLIEIV